MLTYEQWLQKFPQFVGVPEVSFCEFMLEAQMEMGDIVTRWHNQATYNIALGYLISHLVSLSENWATGDSSPAQPFRSKEVDGVMVEYAVTREATNNFDAYLATVYGQQYVKWRRMVFAGPRIV